MQDILKECEIVVDEICEKYGYDSEDKEGNDSLRTVLLKAIPAMLKNSGKEDRDLFYQMIRHTPICITENLTIEGQKELSKKYIGDINKHIVEDKEAMGEYDKKMGAGAFVSSAIFDENMQFKGSKSYVYIQKVSEKAKAFLGTDINVPHLIHELGHAWHSEKDGMTMQEDGTLKLRAGTAELIYSYEKQEDGRYLERLEKTPGLMIEEAINTVAEEHAMAEYMGISLEDMKKEYKKSLLPSSYQGLMSFMAEYMLENLNKEDFEKWRLYGDLEAKERIENLFMRTNGWQNRESSTLVSEGYKTKKEIISKVKKEYVQEFFQEYDGIYFPDIDTMTPLEIIENSMNQIYSMGMVKYNIPINDYGEFVKAISTQYSPWIKEASELKKQDELKHAVVGVPLSQVNDVMEETVKLVELSKDMGNQSRVNQNIGEDR